MQSRSKNDPILDRLDSPPRRRTEMTQDKRQRRSFSRREFMQAAAAAASGTMFTTPALALNPRSKKSQPEHPDPDLILVDGKIHTMDAKNRVVSSVAIKDGRFVGVGNVAREHYGPRTKVISLGGEHGDPRLTQ